VAFFFWLPIRMTGHGVFLKPLVAIDDGRQSIYIYII
jgi:hypothetical protein